MKPGPRDQRPVEARDDVLVYSTPPLTADMEVTGPVTPGALREVVSGRH